MYLIPKISTRYTGHVMTETSPRRTLEKLESVSKIKNTILRNCVFDCQCGWGGLEDLARYFVTKGNKISTKCSDHVMTKIPPQRTFLKTNIYICW